MEKYDVNVMDGLDAAVSKLSEKAIVTMPATDRSAPLTIEPVAKMNCMEWAEQNKDDINELLLHYGAVLLRGFEIDSAEKFNDMFAMLAGEPLEYKNRTSPRDFVFKNVYTSTNHPSDQVIHMHTENSYSRTATRIISFYCLIPPVENGETPIADERELLQYLGEEIVEKFRSKEILYVRNVIPGIGLDLKTIYQTDNEEELYKIFKASGVDYTRVSTNHIRLKWVLPAFARHPITGEKLWFNHMYFGHKLLYSPDVLEVFAEEDLPFVTHYGDGSPIEDEVIEKFRKFYETRSIVFKWKKNDMLLMDNMMYSHGRKPYSGDRKILTAMGQPVYS